MFIVKVRFLPLSPKPSPRKSRITVCFPSVHHHHQFNKYSTSSSSSSTDDDNNKQNNLIPQRFLSSLKSSSNIPPRDKLEISYSRSSGPGGQNVNKVNTKVDVRFNVQTADWLPSPVKDKLILQNPSRINRLGEISFTSDRHRTQPQNLTDCLDKIRDALVQACHVPKETSEETLNKIKLHKSVERLRNKMTKQVHAMKKSNRKKGADF